MKRCFFFFGSLLLSLLLFPVPQQRMQSVCTDASSVLRLHVLANSDSEADQAIKLAVRDAVVPLFERHTSYDDARAFLLEHGKELYDAAAKVLRDHGVSYGVTLSLGTEWFPKRTYGSTVYPAGYYDALCIRLGRADGQNWWCVLFPPLCIVTENGEPAALSELEPESSLLNWLRMLWEEYQA